MSGFCLTDFVAKQKGLFLKCFKYIVAREGVDSEVCFVVKNGETYDLELFPDKRSSKHVFGTNRIHIGTKSISLKRPNLIEGRGLRISHLTRRKLIKHYFFISLILFFAPTNHSYQPSVAILAQAILAQASISLIGGVGTQSRSRGGTRFSSAHHISLAFHMVDLFSDDVDDLPTLRPAPGSGFRRGLQSAASMQGSAGWVPGVPWATLRPAAEQAQPSRAVSTVPGAEQAARGLDAALVGGDDSPMSELSLREELFRQAVGEVDEALGDGVPEVGVDGHSFGAEEMGVASGNRPSEVPELLLRELGVADVARAGSSPGIP